VSSLLSIQNRIKDLSALSADRQAAGRDFYFSYLLPCTTTCKDTLKELETAIKIAPQTQLHFEEVFYCKFFYTVEWH